MLLPRTANEYSVAVILLALVALFGLHRANKLGDVTLVFDTTGGVHVISDDRFDRTAAN